MTKLEALARAKAAYPSLKPRLPESGWTTQGSGGIILIPVGEKDCLVLYGKDLDTLEGTLRVALGPERSLTDKYVRMLASMPGELISKASKAENARKKRKATKP